MLKKSTLREIRSSLGRYIAILAIVALGVGFFSGLKVTREAMVTTANEYIEKNHLFDYRLISTLGFEDQDVKAFRNLDGVQYAEGSVSQDALFDTGKESNHVLMIHSITDNLNKVRLSEGKLPEKKNEFVGDARYFTKKDIGKTITLSADNKKETKDMFKVKDFVLTGIIESPYYLNFERGSSSLGNGTVSGYIYVLPEVLDIDYCTEVFLRLDKRAEMYSDEYKDIISSSEDNIEKETTRIANQRFHRIVKDAQDELDEGKAEYRKNYNDYMREKKNTEKKLKNSKNDLDKAEKELEQNQKKLNSKEKELNRGEKKLDTNAAQLKAKENELNLNENQLIQRQSELEQGKAEYNNSLEQFQNSKPYLSPEQIAETEAKLNATKAVLDEKQNTITSGFAGIENGRREISNAKEKISSGYHEIEHGRKAIREGREKIKDGKKDLRDGRRKYEKGKTKAEKKFREAEAELKEAKADLKDAQKEIDDMEEPDTFTLDRDTNTGYVCFENDSNIVDGIAKVFPVFFFLVAALVCMTTMTRMVDEQRTQIGVLKALGYSNGAIMSKYLFYSGSAALVGCIIGFLGGCYIFPKVIWAAYHIMYDFSSDIEYVLNPVLAVISLAGALLCSMGATFLSCFNEFREVPAELIRPKAPKKGKRILLERIPFIWKRISFLYKVSFRNIFRYKKRFFMMVLGISGCTALLVTGFGLQDSIKNIVNYQYDEIQVYDYSVNFNDPLSEKAQDKFKIKNEDHIKDVLFLHQSAADLLTSGHEKSVSLFATDDNNGHFRKFVNLHRKDGSPITCPEKDEAVICKKLADEYKIGIGDTITLRNDDMKELKVKVKDVFQNYVGNDVYISSDTFKEGYGHLPEIKSAFINTISDKNDQIYASSGKILNEDNVVAVSVNNDIRNRVANMMKSLDYVIILVILAAGALAFIVLYNLTNINITERVREIATIKVLGFYPKETSAYVFRENFFLTAISAVVGLFLGKLLHAFVMTQIKIDTIFFDIIILPKSYVFAVLLTFGFAVIVNLVMYYKLEKINMTESLKSIE